jgi:acetolactate synthase-1/2/3 large subunit
METTKAAPSQAAIASDSQAGTTELNGSDILVKALQAENVKYLWGYPGGAVLHIYDALYKQDTIQHILVRHEQAAVHAADGYARATGDDDAPFLVHASREWDSGVRPQVEYNFIF